MFKEHILSKYITATLFFWGLLLSQTFSQDNRLLTIHFSTTWNQEEINLPISCPSTQNPDSTFIEIFKCYVSHFELFQDNQLVWQEKNSFHLLNTEVDTSLKLELLLPADLQFNSLKFQLGVDSTTSVSGAMGGDLDPTKGMFWAWNTGYINFKLEGTNRGCPTRKNKFQFHLGGYAAPWASLQHLQFPIKQQDSVAINIQLDNFLQEIDLSNTHTVMTPGEHTVQLAKIAKEIFTLADEK